MQQLNPVGNCTLIVRCQAEYSAATGTVTVRGMLETPSTGQRRSFSDVQALLAAIQADLTLLQRQLLLADEQPGP